MLLLASRQRRNQQSVDKFCLIRAQVNFEYSVNQVTPGTGVKF